MKKLLLVVAVILSLPSTAQNCWTLPTNTHHTQVNTNTVYQPYQQNYYGYEYTNLYQYQQPQYQQPYYSTNTNVYYSNNHNVGHLLGDIINGVASEIRKSKRRKNNHHKQNHRSNCSCCR